MHTIIRELQDERKSRGCHWPQKPPPAHLFNFHLQNFDLNKQTLVNGPPSFPYYNALPRVTFFTCFHIYPIFIFTFFFFLSFLIILSQTTFIVAFLQFLSILITFWHVGSSVFL